MANANYRGKVENLAGQLSNVVSTVGKMGSLSCGDLKTGDFIQDLKGYKYQRIIGFAPPAFATSPLSTGFSLMPMAGVAPTGAADSRLVTLPAGAIVSRVHVDNVGTNVTSAGSPTIDVGPGAVNAAPSKVLIGTFTQTGANSTGGLFRNLEDQAVSGGATGVTVIGGPTGGSAPNASAIVPASPNNFLNAYVNTAALTAGALRVVVDYYLLN